MQIKIAFLNQNALFSVLRFYLTPGPVWLLLLGKIFPWEDLPSLHAQKRHIFPGNYLHFYLWSKLNPSHDSI